MKSTRLFSDNRWWWYLPLGFWGSIAVLHFILRCLRERVLFDMDQYWPVSIFLPKHPVWSDIFILVGLGIFWWSVMKAWDSNVSFKKIAVWIGILLIGTNALQGWQEGFVAPYEQHDSAYVHYYKDAVKISDVGSFLESYTSIQPTLRDHPRVHPPGALLFYWILLHVWDSPLFAAFVLAGAGIASLWFLFDILKCYFNEQRSLLVVMLMGVMSGFQIYFWYMFDTLIVLAFTAVLWAYVKNRFWWCVACVWIGGMLTFAVAWIMASLMLFEWWRSGRIEQPIKIGVAFVLGMAGLWWISGFNYWESFQVASAYEGPQGFYPLVDTGSYLLTRFEDMLEPFVFMSPWLSWLVIKGGIVGWKSKSQVGILGLSGVGAFVVFLVAGAYYTGETGRAAAYLYPAYMMLAGIWIEKQKPTLHEQKLLLSLVFVQSVVMQMFGWYGW